MKLWERVLTLGVVAAGLVAASPVRAEDRNDGSDTARVSFIEGTLFGRGPYDTETSELAANAVVRAGDEVFTDEGTFAELELPGETFLRLASATTVVINRIDPTGVEIALAEGAAYLSRGPEAAPARFQAFAGSVDLGGRAIVRVGNDSQHSRLEVMVTDGNAELRDEKSAVNVRAGQKMVWTKGSTRDEAFRVADGDAFDRWNDERERRVRGAERPQHVARGTVGAYELDDQGTWILIDGHYAWRPTVAVGWRPYSHGYWSWCEPYGWTWVSYESWGYTTYHYGRWYYRSHYGWVWYPDPYWGASWVVWAAFGTYVGWAPCDFWGRPIYVYSYYSYYDYGAWCYTDADYFYHGGGYYYHGDRRGGRRNVTTTTTREAYTTAGAAGSAAGRGSRGIGREGKYQIREFDRDTISRYTPVPVKDARADLTPKHIVAAADRGAIKGLDRGARKGDFLERQVKNPEGIKPQPWERMNAPKGSLDRGGAAASGRDVADDPGRAAEGWKTRGSGDKSGTRGADLPTMRGADRGVSDDRGSSLDRGGSSDRGGSTFDRGSSDRGSTFDRGGSSNDRGPSFDRGGSSNGRGSTFDRGSSSQPRTEPKAQPRSEPKRSDPPPSRKDDSDKKDSSGSKGGKRSGWHTPGSGYASSNGNDSGRSSRAPATRSDSGYQRSSSFPSYGRSSSSSNNAPSYGSRSSGSSSGSNHRPAYSGGSGRSSSPGPSYSGGSRSSSGSSGKSSGPSYSGSRSSSSSSKSSGSSGRSSSSSKSSGGGRGKK